MQALKYAAYCSQLTTNDLVEEYGRHHGVDLDEARSRLVVDHAPALEDSEPGPVRIRLVAGGFGPAVTSVVLWLREHDIDIGCIEVTARQVGDSTAVISAHQLIPLPEAEDYLVRRRRKEQQEIQKREPVEWTWEDYKEHFPAERLAVAREIFARFERYVSENDLPWTPNLRSSWLGFQRSGGYYVPGISLYSSRPTLFWVKIPTDPIRLGLSNPYTLQDRWDERNHQWGWDVPDLASVPDVTAAIEISRLYQPESGPMIMPEFSADSLGNH